MDAAKNCLFVARSCPCVSSIIPKLYRCDAKCVSLFNQVIYFQNLSFLFSAAEYVFFDNVTVKNDDGTNVAVEKIVEIAVKAEMIKFKNPTITSKTMKELIKIQHFSTFQYFILTHLSDVFDIEAFYAYMKKNRRTKFILWFGSSISDAYKNRIEEIDAEILATKVFDYRPPYIGFDGLDREKYYKLLDVYIYH